MEKEGLRCEEGTLSGGNDQRQDLSSPTPADQSLMKAPLPSKKGVLGMNRDNTGGFFCGRRNPPTERDHSCVTRRGRKGNDLKPSLGR